VTPLRRATIDDLAAVAALQQAAYAKNRAILGVEPLPLIADYRDVFSKYEVWLAEENGLAGVLILEPRADDMLIWSVATAPAAQGRGVGGRLLAFAETHARARWGSHACGSIPGSHSLETLRGTSDAATSTSASRSCQTGGWCIWSSIWNRRPSWRED
jgi:ribosomal protein S18 acetylase RimI-like enzyme